MWKKPVSKPKVISAETVAEKVNNFQDYIIERPTLVIQEPLNSPFVFDNLKVGKNKRNTNHFNFVCFDQEDVFRAAITWHLIENPWNHFFIHQSLNELQNGVYNRDINKYLDDCDSGDFTITNSAWTDFNMWSSFDPPTSKFIIRILVDFRTKYKDSPWLIEGTPSLGYGQEDFLPIQKWIRCISPLEGKFAFIFRDGHSILLDVKEKPKLEISIIAVKYHFSSR